MSQAPAPGLLEQLGYSVRWVPNADAALQAIEKDGIDLVFSDIVMPGRLDGLGLARIIKEKHPDLPILLATGYSEAAQNVRFDFPILRKPYQMHELSRALAELTRGRLDARCSRCWRCQRQHAEIV